MFKFSEALVDSGTSCITFPFFFIENIKQQFSKRKIECIYDREYYAPDYSMMNCKGKLKDFPDVHIIVD